MTPDRVETGLPELDAHARPEAFGVFWERFISVFDLILYFGDLV